MEKDQVCLFAIPNVYSDTPYIYFGDTVHKKAYHINPANLNTTGVVTSMNWNGFCSPAWEFLGNFREI